METRSSHPSKPVCNHCGAHYPQQPTIPLADDEAAWKEIARHHAARCLWVRTRAGRLAEEESKR